MSGDSEFGLGGRLLEWWSPGEKGVLQFGSAADSCEKVRSFYSGCYRSFIPNTLTAFMAYHAVLSYSSTTLAVLAMRRAFTGRGCRPYLCQVGCTCTGAPHISVRPVAHELGKCDVVKVNPTEQELGNCDVARVDPTEQELGKCDVVRVDLTEQELGNCDVARVDPTEQELGKYDVVRVDSTEQELRNCDVVRVNPIE
ncbi:hypothetical protein B296_00050435 [Ensete ventricosum]|uniref:Uncharacterized protein n=1 Tax=Ensete ventricosum TaxID=4639 RepID=A0A426Y0G0_ENSVE|nr:hypothetical protein B296_00050435 [Ensete ventricosum]